MNLCGFAALRDTRIIQSYWSQFKVNAIAISLSNVWQHSIASDLFDASSFLGTTLQEIIFVACEERNQFEPYSDPKQFRYPLHGIDYENQPENQKFKVYLAQIKAIRLALQTPVLAKAYEHIKVSFVHLQTVP